jgi:hypothetical protein
LRATSRAWAYETGLAAGVKLCRRIPANEYFEHYGPNYELDVRSSNMEDLNTPEYLAKIQRAVYENLREKEAAPGIQMMSKLLWTISCATDEYVYRFPQVSQNWTMMTRMERKMRIWRILMSE